MIKNFLLSFFIIQSIVLQAMDDLKNQQQNVSLGVLKEDVNTVSNWTKEKLESIRKTFPAEEKISEKKKRRPNKKRRNKKQQNKAMIKDTVENLIMEEKIPYQELSFTERIEKVDHQLSDLWVFIHNFEIKRKENEKKNQFHFNFEESGCNPRPNDSKNDNEIDIITENK